MRTPEDIKRLAYERLSEAQILCENGKYDGAFYLAGYSVELMFKAKICERFGIDNLFDGSNCKIEGISEIKKAVQTHNISALLIFSSLKSQFDIDKTKNKILDKTYARLFNGTWSEQSRYRIVGSVSKNDAEKLIQLLQHHEGLLKWIEQN